MTTAKHKYIQIVFALLLVITALSGWSIPTAFADTKQYTTALDDLQKDSYFDVKDYPDIADNYSINLIQIAESVDGELFVYTYQPCQATTYLVATEINMSTSEDVDKTRLFGLTLVNTSGVFGKYVVNDLRVKAAPVRYYNITSIYRDWDKDIDKGTGNDNTIDGVAFKVGRLYTVTTANGEVFYDCKDVEVVKIENKWNSAIVYPDGFSLFNWSACTSHFVAFSSDKKIDALLEADVTFVKQPYTAKAKSMEFSFNPDVSKLTFTYGEQTTERVTLYYDDVVQNDGSGYKGEKHVWNRIETVETFKANNDLNDNAIKQLENKQWVLRYYESARTAEATNVGVGVILPVVGMFVSEVVFNDERTTDVTILRLAFETDGKTYDLGVVDNKQTGHSGANKPLDTVFNLFEWLESVTGVPQWVWILIAVLIPLAILIPVLSYFFPVVGQILIGIVKGVWWLVCLPFKGIAALVQKIKDRKDGNT